MFFHLLCPLLLQVCVTEKASLKPSLPQQSAYFGQAIAVSGDRIVVGESQHTISSPAKSGIAHVFEVQGTTWVKTATLEPSNLAQNCYWMQFGSAVDLDGGIAVIGAPQALTPSQGYCHGAAYVFELGSSGWTETAILDPIDPRAASIGTSVGLDGDTIVLGAPGAFVGGGYTSGAAYVFVRSGAQWTLQARIEPSDAPPVAQFGRSVALQGNRLAVGAPFAVGAVDSAGAVYVFERSGTTWTEKVKLMASDGGRQSRFGWSVDLDQDTVVAGAPHLSIAGVPKTGGAYSFVRRGSVWVQQKLLPHWYTWHTWAGYWVDLDRDLLVIGSFFEPFTGGRFIVYSRSSSTWNEHYQIDASDTVSGDALGFTFSLENERLAVTAPRKDAFGVVDAGQAYVYDIDVQAPVASFYCTPKTSSSGCVPVLGHLGQPSMSTIFTGEPYWVMVRDCHPEELALLAYSVTGPASTPLNGGTLCIQLPVMRTPLKQTQSLGRGTCGVPIKVDFNALIASGQDPSLQAGVQVWMQWWTRDPGFPPPDNVGFSAGLTAIICP